MLNQEDIVCAIKNELEEIIEIPDETLSYGANGTMCAVHDKISVCMLGAISNNEIEVWATIRTEPFGKTVYSSDILQEWLREPISAFQFNEQNVYSIIRSAASFVNRVLTEFRIDESKARNGISAAHNRIVLQSRLKRIRHDAEQEWKNQSYSRVNDLYTSIEEFLTPMEKKRLKLSKDRRGRQD